MNVPLILVHFASDLHQVRVTLNDLNASDEVLRISAWDISRLDGRFARWGAPEMIRTVFRNDGENFWSGKS